MLNDVKKFGQAQPVRFSDFFSFTDSEVKNAFLHATLSKKGSGFKILQMQRSVSDKKNHGKCLIVTPKKYGNACSRNKIRRQLKAIFYEEKLHEVPQTSIILLYKSAQRFSFAELKEILCAAFKKVPAQHALENG